MNRQAKSAIKSLVLTLRHKLEDDIAIQLKRYGFAGERWLPLERLPHIQQADVGSVTAFITVRPGAHPGTARRHRAAR
jgi:hypothetical protein